MEQEMTLLRFARQFLPLMALSTIGCGPTEINITKKPSYADLIVIYNAEVQALDNLEGNRKSLVAEYSETAQAEALKSAMSSLDSVGKQAIPSNPNDALDSAISAAEAQAQLLKTLERSSTGSTITASEFELPEELKRKLAELDAEIANQRARVGRARDARNSAEAQ